MSGKSARNGGKRQVLLSAIRQRADAEEGARLRPAEAVMVLEWAIDCKDNPCVAELLKIFDETGGMALVREALAAED